MRIVSCQKRAKMTLEEKAICWFSSGDQELMVSLIDQLVISKEFMVRQYLTRFPWEAITNNEECMNGTR
jgi:hypothetical protein